MVQGTTPTLLFKFSVDLDLILEWRICFSQEGKENLIKTSADCLVDENKVIYVKLTQEETLAFDEKKILRIQVKALTKDNNVIPSQIVKKYVCEILDKSVFEIENNSPTIIDTSTIDFEFDTEPCGFGLDFEDLYIEKVGNGGGGNITVDKQLSLVSTNPVENKVVTKAINDLDDKVNKKSQTHLNSNFKAMVVDLLGAITNNTIDRYNVGDFFFLAEQNQPDFIFVETNDLTQIETTKINSVNDITEDMPKMGETYFIGGYFLVSAIEVGFNPNDYVKQTEFEELQKQIAQGKVIKSIEQTTTSTESNGVNVITVTFTDGTATEFQVLNGSNGKDGVDGKDYVLTEVDKDEIAELAKNKLPISDYATKEEVNTAIQQAILDSWEVAL